MPKYRYQCECGVQFEALNSVSKHMEPQKCPECGEQAPRMMPKGVEGHFNKEVTGPGPQNTGIHDLDTHIDRVIGQSAHQGMEVIEKRQAAKRRFLRDNPAIHPKQLARLPNGQLGVNTPAEQEFAERANRINSRAMNHFWSKKRPAPEAGR